MGAEQITAIMESLKTSGIGSAFIKKDGSLVYATIKLEDVSAGIIASMSNVADTLLKRAKDEQKEFELVVDSDLLVVIPVKSYYLCGILKNRDQKKLLRDSAEKIKMVI